MKSSFQKTKEENVQHVRFLFDILFFQSYQIFIIKTKTKHNNYVQLITLHKKTNNNKHKQHTGQQN